jgi:hypothetical protein
MLRAALVLAVVFMFVVVAWSPAPYGANGDRGHDGDRGYEGNEPKRSNEGTKVNGSGSVRISVCG